MIVRNVAVLAPLVFSSRRGSRGRCDGLLWYLGVSKDCMDESIAAESQTSRVLGGRLEHVLGVEEMVETSKPPAHV